MRLSPKVFANFSPGLAPYTGRVCEFQSWAGALHRNLFANPEPRAPYTEGVHEFQPRVGSAYPGNKLITIVFTPKVLANGTATQA